MILRINYSKSLTFKGETGYYLFCQKLLSNFMNLAGPAGGLGILGRLYFTKPSYDVKQ